MMSMVPAGTLNLDPNDPNSLFCHFAVAMKGRKTRGRTGGGAVLVDGAYNPDVGPVLDGGMAQFGFPPGVLIQGPLWGPHSGTQQTLQAAADRPGADGRGELAAYGMPKGSVATLGDYLVAQYLLALDGTRSLLQAAWESNIPFEPKLPPPPPPPPPVTTTKLSPLSPASVRAEELKGLFMVPAVQGGQWLPALWIPSPFLEILRAGWPAVKPFAVEALRFYRRLRAKLGDSREIPQEDR